MANDTVNNEEKKLATSVRIEADLNAAVEQLMKAERRPSMANTMEWLLATHPLVKKILAAAEPAAAGH